MAFTAKDVQALREKTGVGMMDCKKALTETDGDMDKAIDILREKGLAAAAKKAGRIAAEGIVYAYYDDNQSCGVIVEVNSETDFVAKNADFNAFVKAVAETIAVNKPANLEELLACKIVGAELTVDQQLKEKILTIGENLKIRRFQIMDGIVSTYVHAGGRIGVMVQFEGDAFLEANETFRELGKDVAMQIAALNPLYLNPESIPADVLEHEKKIMTEQVLNEGKPAAIAEKIVAGRINKYYKEACLLEQPYVKDGDVSVGKHIQNIAASINMPVSVAAFVRFEKGEGLQKRSDNFADEVAGMIK